MKLKLLSVVKCTLVQNKKSMSNHTAVNVTLHEKHAVDGLGSEMLSTFQIQVPEAI